MNILLLLTTCFAIHCCLSEKVRYDNYRSFKVTPKTQTAVKVLTELEEMSMSGYNFWSHVGPVETPVQVMVPPYKISEMEHLAESVGMDVEVMMDNVQDNIDAEERSTSRSGEFGWTEYHTLEDINEWLVKLTEEFPNVVTLIKVNATYEGRSIYGVKVQYPTSNVSRSVFIESNIHARECITSATVTHIRNEFLRTSNETIRNLAEGHIWYFFPVFNPDGFVYSHTTDRMWRKTRVSHSILCIGADPNRNWGHFWNHGGTSNSPCTEIYRGPAAFSEPSCRVMADFIETVADDLVAYFSFHSFTQLLLIPYGYTAEHLDNYDKMYRIGLKSAEAFAQRYGTQYRVGTVYEIICTHSFHKIDV